MAGTAPAAHRSPPGPVRRADRALRRAHSGDDQPRRGDGRPAGAVQGRAPGHQRPLEQGREVPCRRRRRRRPAGRLARRARRARATHPHRRRRRADERHPDNRARELHGSRARQDRAQAHPRVRARAQPYEPRRPPGVPLLRQGRQGHCVPRRLRRSAGDRPAARSAQPGWPAASHRPTGGRPRQPGHPGGCRAHLASEGQAPAHLLQPQRQPRRQRRRRTRRVLQLPHCRRPLLRPHRPRGRHRRPKGPRPHHHRDGGRREGLQAAQGQVRLLAPRRTARVRPGERTSTRLVAWGPDRAGHAHLESFDASSARRRSRGELRRAVGSCWGADPGPTGASAVRWGRCSWASRALRWTRWDAGRSLVMKGSGVRVPPSALGSWPLAVRRAEAARGRGSQTSYAVYDDAS